MFPLNGYLFEKRIKSNNFGEAYFDINSIVSQYPHLVHEKWYIDINYIAFKTRRSMRNIIVNIICTSCFEHAKNSREIVSLGIVEKRVTHQRTVFSKVPLRCAKKTFFPISGEIINGTKIFFVAAENTPATQTLPQVAEGQKWRTSFKMGISLFVMKKESSTIYFDDFLQSKSINSTEISLKIDSPKMNAQECDIYTIAGTARERGIVKLNIGRISNTRPLLATGRWFIQIETIIFQDHQSERRAILSIHSPQIKSPINEPISLGFIEKVANYSRYIFSGADFSRRSPPREITHKEGCQDIEIRLKLLDNEAAVPPHFPPLGAGYSWPVYFSAIATLYIPKAQPRNY